MHYKHGSKQCYSSIYPWMLYKSVNPLFLTIPFFPVNQNIGAKGHNPKVGINDVSYGTLAAL